MPQHISAGVFQNHKLCKSTSFMINFCQEALTFPQKKKTAPFERPNLWWTNSPSNLDVWFSKVLQLFQWMFVCTWRIIPVSNWLVTLVYMPCSWPFGRGPTPGLRDLTITMPPVAVMDSGARDCWRRSPKASHPHRWFPQQETSWY